jgi:hypothetical protein
VQSYFAPLRQRMTRTLGEVVKEPRTRQTHKELLDRIVGDTTLRQYYTQAHNPTANISHWCESVYKRARRAIQKQGSAILLRLLQAAERRKQAAQRQRSHRKSQA